MTESMGSRFRATAAQAAVLEVAEACLGQGDYSGLAAGVDREHVATPLNAGSRADRF